MGAVEVNDVEALAAFSLPAFRDGQRVGGENGFLGVVALVQPDTVAAAQVDGGDDFHIRLLLLRRRRARQRVDSHFAIVRYRGSEQATVPKTVHCNVQSSKRFPGRSGWYSRTQLLRAAWPYVAPPQPSGILRAGSSSLR